MRGIGWKLVRQGAMMTAIVLLGGFLSATLMRIAPGFDVDERQLDPHLNAQSLEALRQQHAVSDNIFVFYSHALQRALHGDLGTSISLSQPVAALLRERSPLTLRLVALGWALGWVAAVTLALSACWLRLAAFDIGTTILSGTFLCLPAAVLALLSVLCNLPGAFALALIVFPRIYRYARNLLSKSYAQQYVLAARAKGLSELRILLCHVLPVVGPQLIALAGVSVSVAFGASIPLEALCGLPGVGQLAWQAALSRDLPLLTTIGVLLTLVTFLANSSADIVGHLVGSQEA